MSTPTTPLLNLPRAREIMTAEGVDGIVAALPHNVVYLSGYRGLLMDAAHFDAAFFAVLPRRDELPAALVLPSMELRRLESQGGTWMDEVFIFSSPPADDQAALRDGKPYTGWPIAENRALSGLEQRGVAATRAQQGRVAANGRGALVRAVEAAGLDAATIVADDARVADWLAQAGAGRVRCRTDANLLRRIRQVKTAPEIDLLRQASAINEAAARTAMRAFHDGADWRDIEIVFATELARHGARASYLMCGAGGPRHGSIRAGEPMFVDALSTFQHYHGDFGRCVVLGEPDELMRQRHRALCAGFAAIQPLLKPGTRFDELAAATVAAVQAHGLPEFVYATPHNVGLEHTDDPRPLGGQQGMTPDVILEPGMVFNIDMPFTEIGWGSVHIEDTVLVTADGYELLTSDDLDIVCV